MEPAAFAALPDDSRLWLLALAEPPDAARLEPEIRALLGAWRHKGVRYAGAWTLLEGRILAIAEPTLAAQPSGCAIDGMLRGLGHALGRLGVATEPPEGVLVRLQEGLRTIPRSELEARLADRTLDWATPVLDLSLYTLGDLRQGKLVRPLGSTWIGRKYKIQAPVSAGA